MRLPRMTMRRWMIAVALIATGLGACEVARRRQRYRQLAAMLARRELGEVADLSAKAFTGPGCVIDLVVDPETAELPAALEGSRQRALYYRRMSRKYKLAARYPWLPVEPDPPEPR